MRSRLITALLVTFAALPALGCGGGASASSDEPLPYSDATRDASALAPPDATEAHQVADEVFEGPLVECPTPPPPEPQAPARWDEAQREASGEDEVTGTVSGRLVHPSGEAIAGMRMLACTPSICYWDETDNDGRFVVSDLSLGPLKMQSGDPSGAHWDILFFHLLTSEDVSELPRDLIVPLREKEEEPLPWEDAAGTLSLAMGALELDVNEGALTYPAGTKDKALTARYLSGSDLPPYDWSPWAGREEETLAFVINPVGVTSSAGVRVRVIAPDLAPCTHYHLWSIDSKTGRVRYSGNASVEEREGQPVLVSSAGALIEELTTLIFSPAEL